MAKVTSGGVVELIGASIARAQAVQAAAKAAGAAAKAPPPPPAPKEAAK